LVRKFNQGNKEATADTSPSRIHGGPLTVGGFEVGATVSVSGSYFQNTLPRLGVVEDPSVWRGITSRGMIPVKIGDQIAPVPPELCSVPKPQSAPLSPFQQAQTLALKAFDKDPSLKAIHLTRDPQTVDLAGTIEDCPHIELEYEEGRMPYSESYLDLPELDAGSWDIIESMRTGTTISVFRAGTPTPVSPNPLGQGPEVHPDRTLVQEFTRGASFDAGAYFPIIDRLEQDDTSGIPRWVITRDPTSSPAGEEVFESLDSAFSALPRTDFPRKYTVYVADGELLAESGETLRQARRTEIEASKSNPSGTIEVPPDVLGLLTHDPNHSGCTCLKSQNFLTPQEQATLTNLYKASKASAHASSLGLSQRLIDQALQSPGANREDFSALFVKGYIAKIRGDYYELTEQAAALFEEK
jgi:hypothetical protein